MNQRNLLIHFKLPKQARMSLRVLSLTLALAVLLGAVTLSASAAPLAQEGTYTVQPGDYLAKIARNTGMTVSELINLNGATYPSLYSNPSLIFPGWVLKLSPGATVPGSSGGGTYTVQAGDYLAKISGKTGTSVSDLINLNKATYPSLATNPNIIYVGWVLKLSAGASVPASEPEVTSEPPPSGSSIPPASSSGGFELGGQTHDLSHPGEMRHAGMTWVKFQVKWSPGSSYGGEAGRLDNAHNQGFKVLFSVTGQEYPSSIDYGAYKGYLAGLAGMGADGIEVWNEMNIDREWPTGQISGSSYVNNMLAPAYNAIKGANANTLVISGALSPTGAFGGCTSNGCNDDVYLQQMAAAGAANYADCIGMHYNAGTTSPYATSGANVGSYHYSWYYQPMVNVYYNPFGGSRKLCITELGYLVGEGTSLPGAFSWASNTSLSEHTQWLAENVSLASSSGKVRLLIVWNVDIGDSSGGDPQGGYSIIRGDGSCPACNSLNGVMGG